MAEQQAPVQIDPQSLDDYLEVMSKAVFQSGMSWRVVEAKWPDIKTAFREFDIEVVAGLSDADISALAEDPRVIRNRRKIEAIVENAGRIVERAAEHGSFQSYLRTDSGFEARIKQLKKDFKFLGDMGSYYFLYVVGEEVPPHEECVARLGR